MPPTFLADALHRYMYLLTVLLAASIAVSVGFAVAGPVDPQCRGNSPKKICPELSPASGATVSGEVTVSAQVPDTVVGIAFSVNGSPLGPEDTIVPYEVPWDTTKAPDGEHTIAAVARDAEGKTSTAESNVEVSNARPDTSPPSVQLTTPGAGATVSGQVNIAADASDDVGVAGVQFKLDGASLEAEDASAPYTVGWDTTNTPNGQHALTAVARDAAGNTSTAQRTVNVSNTSSGGNTSDLTAPTVQLTSPTEGATVSGQTAVSGDAFDNVAVAGVQFTLDGANLGSEDTTAPYNIGWDTTKTANGQHTLTAIARDAAGNKASSSRTVSVSNTSSTPDTTAPKVQLTSPDIGATFSGQMDVSANASDDVGVAGVQFKLDGANLGAEDTVAPYSVGWDTTKAANGQHAVIAVARDAAGNTSSALRTVGVSNDTGTGPKLSFAPPALSNPVTINVTNANKDSLRSPGLDASKDYILKITERLVGRPGLWIEGGHNVVVIGGEVAMETPGDSAYWDRTGVKIRGTAAGHVFIEGLLVTGAYLHDGIVTAAPNKKLTLVNVRVTRVATIDGNHPDCLQTQGGLGALNIDKFTCYTTLQGLFLQNTSGILVGRCDLRRVNTHGAFVAYWQETVDVGPISLSDVWIGDSQRTFGLDVWPTSDAYGQTDPTRRAIVSADGTYLTFQNSNISGRINKGNPPNGDFVPPGVAGMSYSSPGYL